MNNKFLPISKGDLEERGWKELDIILISGDAYVDHPSYGPAVIGRVLEDAGFKVGVIAQPDWKSSEDFLKLGRPNLFFGVTAGNLDSILSNYTPYRKPRRKDYYSPGGKTGLRPNRATIVYANKVREVFPDVPIVLGGLEASLRRLAYHDFWSDEVRRSILLDARGDILVYGLAERPVREIAMRLKNGENIRNLDYIRGTAVIRSHSGGFKDFVVVPSFEEVKASKDKFNEAFRIAYLEGDPFRGKTVMQKHGERFLVQFPPAYPLTQEEMDRVYGLNYERSWHPVYDREGGVPGFETVRFSITSHRGCCGECSFCSLYAHQGRIIQSRSSESIIKEIKLLVKKKDFKGTITDIGGPTANLYEARCESWIKKGACRDKKCLFPAKCKSFKLGYAETLSLWKEAMAIPGVKHLFISSGVRYDLLTDKSSEEYLKNLCQFHLSGRLKVAPEHAVDAVLEIMNKPPLKAYEEFVEKFKKMNKTLNKKQYLVNYFISAHPGSDLNAALEMALYLVKGRLHPEQIQDFMPLPGTLSGSIYYTGRNPFTGREVYVPRSVKERKMQRALMQYNQPENKNLILAALGRLNKKKEMTNLFFSGIIKKGDRETEFT